MVCSVWAAAAAAAAAECTALLAKAAGCALLRCVASQHTVCERKAWLQLQPGWWCVGRLAAEPYGVHSKPQLLALQLLQSAAEAPLMETQHCNLQGRCRSARRLKKLPLK